MKKIILKQIEILDLFISSIDNAYSLFTMAQNNSKAEETAHISLGLAELALEEIGKSYTCLAYYCLAEKDGDHWSEFWKDWKNHKVKAYRAFFYEFFSLLRIQIKDSEDTFPTKRNSIPEEKEISFYVDYDCNTNKVIVPRSEIEYHEMLIRITSVFGPLNAALTVKDLLLLNTANNYRLAISRYALNTITSDMYQQDVNNIIERMKNGDVDYDRALNDIYNMYNRKDHLTIASTMTPRPDTQSAS